MFTHEEIPSSGGKLITFYMRFFFHVVLWYLASALMRPVSSGCLPETGKNVAHAFFMSWITEHRGLFEASHQTARVHEPTVLRSDNSHRPQTDRTVSSLTRDPLAPRVRCQIKKKSLWLSVDTPCDIVWLLLKPTVRVWLFFYFFPSPSPNFRQLSSACLQFERECHPVSLNER